MTADDLVTFARVLLDNAGGLRSTTEQHLRTLATNGAETGLGTTIGDGKTTARAIYFVATGRFNHDMPRHERRAVEHYIDRFCALKKVLSGVA